LEHGLSCSAHFFGLIILQLILGANDDSLLVVVLYVAFLSLWTWFVVAQGAKRCHDRGNSGWYHFIPFYGFWMLFADGIAGENDCGPDSKHLAQSQAL
jgi:uncharacterized membrane protein YhaH (DUF805 family)